MGFLVRGRRLVGWMAAGLLPLASLSPVYGQSSPFLWEVTGESGKAYLLGSIHVGKPDFYPLPDVVEQAFAVSDALVVEVNLSKDKEAEMSMKMLMAGIYRDGRSLDTAVAPDTWAQFEAFLDERGIPAHNFKAMRPWMAAMMISVAEMQKLGFDPELGIDKHFLGAASEAGKRVEELESADFQINLLSGFSDEMQEKFLLHTLRDAGRFEEAIGEMTAAWRTGNDEEMTELMFGDVGLGGELEELGDKLINERNYGMAEKIAGMIDSGGTWFVVVGAGHLIGEEGVPTLLEADARGFRVERIAQVAAAPAR